MRRFAGSIIILTTTFALSGQRAETQDFREVVESAYKQKYNISFSKVCPIYSDWVAARIFSEYGAMFIAEDGIRPPESCIYDNEADLARFQSSLDQAAAAIGGVVVTLQRPAMAALVKALQAAAKVGLTITPRGGAAASARSYSTTVRLWNSRFDPGLNYWTRRGKITSADAAAARRASVRQQIEMVLLWETKNIWFSKDRSKSILYSVAAPGASQHNFLVALDVEQYGNARTRRILADHGWFQTVISDLPHFTYLGHSRDKLRALGLRPETVGGQEFWIPNIKD